MLLRLRPLWLLRINDALKPYTDVPLPIIGISVPIRFALFVGFFHYHPRVLGQQPFMAAIRGQLQDLTNEPNSISEELLERLLRQRRILVIVDHLSEMSEATRKAIRPELPDFCVNALVITSRTEETLGKVIKTTLKPLRIEGNRLSLFMEAYLTQRGKRDLFTDAEFFTACSRLSLMVGQRHITVL
ncbi:MAG: hypothetical protein ICV63_09260 [Coleofasciculus sp. Co-bin14]|nr:hypothetical protein [Coleofasciculus sp. Co-bin14]